MSAEIRHAGDPVTAEVEVVEVQRGFFHVQHANQLIVSCFDGGQKFESVEVLEGVEAVVGQINSLQIGILCYFLNLY